MGWYKFFPQLLNMSATASIVILIVLLLRLGLKKLPKIISYVLWSAVLFRLLCPVSITSSFSLFGFVNVPTSVSSSMTSSIEYIPKDIIYTKYPPVVFPVSDVSKTIHNTLPQDQEQLTTNPLKIPISIAAYIWSIGVLGILLYSAVIYVKLKKKLVGVVPLRDNIFVSDYITSPFVMGMFHPKIYLPSTLSGKEQEYIILHEQHHIKRFDHVFKTLSFFSLCIHWFNPLVWLSFVLFSRDMEMSCDEAVVKKMGEEIRADYSASLLSLATGHRIIAGTPLAFGEGNTKERIKNLANWKKPVIWVAVFMGLICIIVVVSLLTNPKEKILYVPEPFSHNYRVENIVYDAPQYSFSFTADNTPQYSLTSDYMLFSTVISQLSETAVSENSWVSCGKAKEITLTADNFDRCFSNNGKGGYWDKTSAAEIRHNNKNAWSVMDASSDVFYYILQQKNGDVYLSYGYYDTEGETNSKSNNSSIRWLFKLTRTNLLICNAVSERINTYIEPSYFFNEFDFNYDTINKNEFFNSVSLEFMPEWDTDTLVVSEDYYENYGNAVIVQRETYELKCNADEKFELNILHRNPDREEEAVYFVNGKEGTYVMKIKFITDTTSKSSAEIEYNSETEINSLETAVSAAVLEYHKPKDFDGLIRVESHKILAAESGGTADSNLADIVVVYALVLYQAYSPYIYSGDKLESEEGSYIPTALTFSVGEDGTYTLAEYWIPRDGSYYVDDIRNKFPKAAADEALNSQQYIDELSHECQEKALTLINEEGMFDDKLTELFEIICSSPAASLRPSDYIEQHHEEYDKLVAYGKFTMRYCFKQFSQGNQTDIKGYIMAAVCEDIAAEWGETLLIDKLTPMTGQEWFNEFRDNAERLEEQYNGEDLEKYYPASWLLLQMVRE